MTTATQSISYTVPPGYVAILRKFRYKFARVVEGAGVISPVCSLLVNNIIQPDYNNMSLGYYMDKPHPCYILAGENQLITFTITLTLALAPSTTELFRVYVELYGNALLGRALPLNYEPGNLR